MPDIYTATEKIRGAILSIESVFACSNPVILDGMLYHAVEDLKDELFFLGMHEKEQEMEVQYG